MLISFCKQLDTFFISHKNKKRFLILMNDFLQFKCYMQYCPPGGASAHVSVTCR